MLDDTRRRIEHLQRYESATVKLLGIIELLLAAMLVVAVIYTVAVGEDASIFAWPIPFLIIPGIWQCLRFYTAKSLTPSLGVLLIAETWLLAFVVLAIPFYLYGFSPVDAAFEAISGFTTTGASIAPDIQALPSSLLLWRGIIQWAGGITVVIIFAFLLPMLGMGGTSFEANEFVGSDTGGYVSRVTSRALNFVGVYSVLTVIEVVTLLILNVNMLDSVCISMSNVATGGLLPRNDSMASYSIEVQAVTLVFMFLGATNYYLLFRAVLRKDYRSLIESEEFLHMTVWFAACTAAVTAILVYNQDPGFQAFQNGDLENYLWKAAYAVVSAGTSTGFAITDYTPWPLLALMILLALEFVGGMSGSTAGGVKMYRMILMRSYIASGLRRMMHPHAITTVRVNGRNVDTDTVISAVSMILLFVTGLVFSMAVMMFLEPKLDLETDMGIVVAFLSNTGISIGAFGPLDNYDQLSDLTKIFLCFLMWFGRLELVMALMLFTKSFWDDVRLSVDSKVRTAKQPPLPPRSRMRRKNAPAGAGAERTEAVSLAGFPAHGQDPEHGRVAGLELVDRPGGDLGLPV